MVDVDEPCDLWSSHWQQLLVNTFYMSTAYLSAMKPNQGEAERATSVNQIVTRRLAVPRRVALLGP